MAQRRADLPARGIPGIVTLNAAHPITDVASLIGGYPFRHLPHPDPDVLARVLEREGIARAWVGYLPGAFHRDPAAGNDVLYRALDPYRQRLLPAPAVRPDWPRWERELQRSVSSQAVAIRAWAAQWSFAAGHPALVELASACAEAGLPILLTLRLEDTRQRHPHDVAGDVSAALVRELARARTGARIVVTAAGRAFIEEVHWGLTPDEQALVWYDTSWIWGPPEDDFAHLLRSVGADRFVYGTGWPLRLAQVSRANLALLPDDLQGVVLADPTTWTRR
jgi:predicted TIM-barrel fold metal-dependent hydrolase